MKKPILRTVKCVIPAQDATVTSAIGPLLGQYGVNIKDFCNKFNEFTKIYDENLNLTVNITIFKDKTLIFDISNVVGSFLIFEEQFVFNKEKHEVNIEEIENENNQLILKQNYKDILGKNIVKILYFFDINSNFFFFSEFVLNYLSKKTFNDYFSQMNFTFDFYAIGKFFQIQKFNQKNFIFSRNNCNSKFIFQNFLFEIDEYLHPIRFKKKKSFFLQAGEDEDVKNFKEEEAAYAEIENLSKTLYEKNLKYFDLESLEEYKQMENMKKKKSPKNVSRIVKMQKDVIANKLNDTVFKENLNNEIDNLEDDESFYYFPEILNLSIIYKIVKYKSYLNKDINELKLFRTIVSSVLSMEIKIIDDIF